MRLRIMNFQGSGDWVLRRDYPEPGDCAMVSRSERECLVLTRPEAAARRVQQISTAFKSFLVNV